jgi:hypothetical protein
MANQVEGVDEALAQMREEGRRAGYAEGYTAGRADASAILGNPEAEGRRELAATIAANGAITPEQAGAMLKSAPKADKGYLARIASDAPSLGTTEQPANDAADKMAARKAELGKLTKAVSAGARR